MKTKNIQKYLDLLISKLFLWVIPKSVTPNQVTAVRFMMVPFVYIYLTKSDLTIGLLLFLIAACTDFIDGAMARTRDQITDIGKIIDPVADKLLIGAALAAIAFEYLIVQIFLVFIGLEIISAFSGAALAQTLGRPKGSNTFGKIKMLLQTAAVLLFIIGLSLSSETLILISTYILFVGLIFAVLSAYGHLNKTLGDLLHKTK